MKHYLIYQIKNKLNNKIYIGKHITDNINDSYMGSGVLIQFAIKKYGVQNFEKKILFECSSENEMNLKEEEIVNEDFVNRDDTYNLTIGGFGTWFKPNQCSSKERYERMMGFLQQKTPEELVKWKKHMVKIHNEWWNSLSDNQKQYFVSSLTSASKKHYELYGHPFYGKKHSIESKKKMSEKAKKRIGKLNSQYGKMWICNDLTHESKTILKTEPIPDGWKKGRFMR